MPNTRRRRFSVQNTNGTRDPSKLQSELINSHKETNLENTTQNRTLKCKLKKKPFPSVTINAHNSLEIVAEKESVATVAPAVASNTSSIVEQNLDNESVVVDKDVTASSSNIDLFNILSATDGISQQNSEETIKSITDSLIPTPRFARQIHRDGMSLRTEKHRQHRVKVRSPKRRMAILDTDTPAEVKPFNRTIGTVPIDWIEEQQIMEVTVTETIVPEPEETRSSEHSLDDMCRICHGGEVLSSELGQLISACSCRGTVGRVHVKCLERWLTESGKSRCELCGTRYITRRVHRYGVPRALVMWILSQNTKQLMVDSLGIMLMSPLAVLAAWLSGRTLAGLMTQDNQVTPWPLASTFVLACMTLVCYYCWIVSAATRHALGWWIWYRSQYEVRLQLLNEE